MPETRCERSDLIPDQCWHCRGDVLEPEFAAALADIEAPDWTQRDTASPWVPAEWPGACSVCGERFGPGTLISRMPGQAGWQCCTEENHRG